MSKFAAYRILTKFRSDDSLIVKVWDALVTLTATYAALLIPIHLVLGSSINLFRFHEEEIATTIFVIDFLYRGWLIGWKFNAISRDRWGGSLLSRRGWLLLDLVATIPFAAIFGVQLLLLLRLFKLARVARFMGDWRQRFMQQANVLRLVFFLYWLGLATHWIACGWLSMGGGNIVAEGWRRYVQALYWCLTTLATIGYGDITPQTDAQRIYAMGAMIFGVAMFGYVIGNITQLLANIDPAKARYLENMERITAFMRYRNLPYVLQRRIRDYYNYLWEKRLGYDEMSVLSQLPPTLRTEVALFLIRDILVKVPMFQGAEESFLKEIALELRPVVFTPGDFVFREGDPGNEMYFISRGRLDVLSGDGSILFKTLGEGDFFGEIALLESRSRTASIRAVDYCDLYSLDKETFDRVLNHYPNIAEHIQAEASLRNERNVSMRET